MMSADRLKVSNLIRVVNRELNFRLSVGGLIVLLTQSNTISPPLQSDEETTEESYAFILHCPAKT